jgi:hypothetical protein
MNNKFFFFAVKFFLFYMYITENTILSNLNDEDNILKVEGNFYFILPSVNRQKKRKKKLISMIYDSI